MGDGGDGSDHSERCVLGHGQAPVTRKRVTAEKLGAGNQLDDLQLLDLVIEPADAGFFEFGPPQFVTLRGANPYHAGDRLGPVFDPLLLQLLERPCGGGDGVIHPRKHAPVSVGRWSNLGRRRVTTTQLGQDLFHHCTNDLLIGLNHQETSSLLLAICFEFC